MRTRAFSLAAKLAFLLVPVAQAQYFPPGGASGGSFSSLTSGTNTTGAFICGTGCSIVPGGSGSIVATNGALTTGGTYTGTHDFNAATVSLPSIFLRSDASFIMTAGARIKGAQSASLAGIATTCGALGSYLISGGSIVCDPSGNFAVDDGTNLNALLTFLGSGPTLGTPPTAGHHMLWGTNYKPTTTGSAIWGAANGGTGVNTLTGLAKGNGTSAFSQATAADLSAANYVAGGGTAQAQTATYSPAVAALANGLYLCWLPLAANSVAAPTFAPNGLTAKPITKFGATALVANDIKTTAIACAVYDGTEWQLQNPQVTTDGMSIGGAVTSGTSKSIPYIDSSGFLAQANSSGHILRYDDTNQVVEIGTSAGGAVPAIVAGSTNAIFSSAGGALWAAKAVVNLDNLNYFIRNDANTTDINARAANLNFRIDDVIYASLTAEGHLSSTGTTPSLTSCGTSPSRTGTDITGTITEGSVSTGCVLTFGVAYTATPHCTLTPQSGLAFSYAVSTTAITITNIGALSSTKIDYACRQ